MRAVSGAAEGKAEPQAGQGDLEGVPMARSSRNIVSPGHLLCRDRRRFWGVVVEAKAKIASMPGCMLEFS